VRRRFEDESVMKSVIKALLAASMLMPVVAQAQEQDGRERGQGRRGEWGQRAPRAERSGEVGVDAQVRAERPQRGDFRQDAAPAPQVRQDTPRPAPDGRFDRQQQDRGFAGRQPRDQRADGGWNRDGDGGARRQAEVDRSGNRGWDGSEQANAPRWRDPSTDARRRADGDPARQGQRYDRRPAYGQTGQPRGDWRGNGAHGWGDRGSDDRGWNDGRNRGDGRDWNDGRRYDTRSGAWNRGWRNDDRFDWGRYRQANRGAYRLPRYYAPSGWGYGYRRFSVGVSLSSILFSENYWIEDPYTYRLPEAYGPYRWVRYYDDALLVDLRSGQVVDTVYDIFD